MKKSRIIKPTPALEPPKSLFGGDFPPVAALLFVVALFYHEALFGSFVWEDFFFIENNLFLRDIKNFPSIFLSDDAVGTGASNPYYRPLTTLSFGIDWLLWNGDPRGFHFTNLAAHLAVTASLYLLVKTWVSPVAAFGAALFFGLHPANTEPVCYVNARADLFCAFFALMTVKYQQAFDDGGKIKNLILALAFFSLGLMSKILALLIPAIICLDWILKGRFKNNWTYLEPYFLLGLFFLVVRYKVVNMGSFKQDDVVARLATAGTTMLHYIKNAAFPFDLKVFYQIPIQHSFLNFYPLASWTVLASIFVFLARWIKKGAAASLGVVWFFLFLLPVSGVVMLMHPTLIADRYLYLPLLGVSISLGYGLDRLVKSNLYLKHSKPLAAAFALIIILFGARVDARVDVWKDNLTFWAKASEEAPNNPAVKDSLATALAEAGRYDEAEKLFMELKHSGENSVSVDIQLATISLAKGDIGRAEGLMAEAMKSHPENPWPFLIYAQANYLKGDFAGAKEALGKSLAINPWNDQALSLKAALEENSQNTNR